MTRMMRKEMMMRHDLAKISFSSHTYERCLNQIFFDLLN